LCPGDVKLLVEMRRERELPDRRDAPCEEKKGKELSTSTPFWGGVLW